jgi:hypothetical protein
MKASEQLRQGLPFYAYFLIDGFSFVLSLGPGLLAYLAVIYFVQNFYQMLGMALVTLLAPFVLVSVFIFVLFVFRICLPRLKRGVYPLGINMGMASWYCHLALSRAATVCGLSSLLNIFYVTKFLHWRALGMKIAFGVNSSISVSFVDLPLISIGKGCTIADGVFILCHTFVGDRLFVSPVEIGENVFVGANCILGPRTKIGDNAWIGMSNFVAHAVPTGSKIDNFFWEHGKKGSSRIGFLKFS